MNKAYFLAIAATKEAVEDGVKHPGSTFGAAFRDGYKGFNVKYPKNRVRYAMYVAGKEYRNRTEWDIFGNRRPVQIEGEEWWFNGRIIQKCNHPELTSYVSWNDNDDHFVEKHYSMKDAIQYAIENPCHKPKRFPKYYL